MLRVTQLSGFGVGSGAATTAKTVSAGAGSYVLAGAAATIQKPFMAGAGAYSLTGTAATLSKVSPATWDPATVALVTLSGGNLVATNTGTTQADQGAHVAFTSSHSTGKYYFEITITTLTTVSATAIDIGVGISTTTFTNLNNAGGSGVCIDVTSPGNVFADGSSVSTGGGLGGASTGTVYGIAVDCDNDKIWFRKTSANLWNNSGTANPATNTGGIATNSGALVPFVTFGGTGNVAGNVFTANFGATSFASAAPSGFTAGWPA